MLKWIDWLGVLIRNKSLSKKELIFDSIGPQFIEIINISTPLVEPEIQTLGPKHWAGLLTVAHAQKVKWTEGYYQALLNDESERIKATRVQH